jgi:FkbM family methyltransferase
MKGRQDDSISLEALQDFSMYVQENDQAVGKVIKDQHEYEPHVSAIFRDRLREGMNVLDVGANIGYFTMLASALVKSSGSVIAIEPNSTNVKLIEASRRANGFNNISIIQAAAGRAPGLLVINSAYSNGTTARLPDEIQSLMAATTVACLKIDDLVPVDKKIDFIKIDIEGAELNALTGASELIRRCRPTIVSEFSPDMMPMISGTDGPGYLSFLIDFGYQISIVETLGVITPCGKDISRVMNAYSQSGVDHIDILLD